MDVSCRRLLRAVRCFSAWQSLLVCVLAAQFVQAQPSSLLENVSFDEVLAWPAGEPNEVLDYGTDPLQYGKFWLPDSPQQPAPLVVLIHGGCWLNSFDVHHTDALSQALARDGFAVWAIEYRRSGDPGGGWPGTFHDVMQAIRFAADFPSRGVDNGRMAVIGHSAGGHLALLAGAALGIQTSDSAANKSLPARGVLPADAEQREPLGNDGEVALIVSLAGIADIETYAAGSSSCEQAAVQFMGVGPTVNPAAYAAANPARLNLHPNTVLMHGELDTIVPPSQLDGIAAGRIIRPEAGHFDWIHPQTAAYAELVWQLRQALRQ